MNIALPTAVMFMNISAVVSPLGVHAKLIYKKDRKRAFTCCKIGARNSKRPTIHVPMVAFETWEQAQLGGK